jgi:hydrophobe/amphiphile efflux-1 (HAE1) family protein
MAEPTGNEDAEFNFCRPFVERPVAISLVAIGVLILGLFAWSFIPVAIVPQVEYPTINVVGTLPGASAATMATSVAAPLERQFGLVNGITAINSVSSPGTTSVRLQFSFGRDIDLAAVDVQSAIANAARDLPADMPTPPTLFKENPADRAIVVMALTSDVLPLSKIDQYADTVVVRHISNLPGVSRASIANEEKYAIRVRIDPAALGALAVSLEDVRNAIQRATVNQPKGRLESGDSITSVESNDQVFDADNLRDIVIAHRNGAIVRLADVGTVEDDIENDRSAGWYNGHPAIIVAVRKSPGANIVRTVDNLSIVMASLRALVPASINLNIVTDRAETIRASINDIEFTLLLTIVLVIFIIFVFLRRFWAVVIPSITIPLSLLAAVLAIQAFGFTLDNLSLMALTISVGFGVDDAIVVIENIMRYIEDGKDSVTAAITGGGQVAATIASITLSLIAVFIPIFFMDGIVGRLFREFAVTVSVAILASAAISLTLLPALCAKLLRPAAVRIAPGAGSVRRGAQFFSYVTDVGYRRSLVWVLQHRTLTLIVFMATLGLTAYMYVIVPKGFFPQQDNSRIFGFVEASSDTPFATTTGLVERLTAIIRSDPDVYSVTSYVGVDVDENAGGFVINLKPRDRRTSTIPQVMGRLRVAATAVKGLRYFMQPEAEIVTGTDAGRTEYQYTLVDGNEPELEKWSHILVDRLRKMPNLLDVSQNSDRGSSVVVKVDRTLAGRMGVDSKEVDETLYDAFGARRVAEIYTDSNEYHVLLQVEPEFQTSPDALQFIHIASGTGKQVPLAAFATFEQADTVKSVRHRGQFPADILTFNLAPGISIGQAVGEIRQAEAELGKPLTLQTSFDGAAAEFERSLASQPLLIGAAALVVYIVLGILYESFIHPITIVSSLPSAGIGALVALMLTGNNLDVMGLIGIILLIGIVKKNAIMMIDFAVVAERSGLSPEAATLEACLVRFRPIMMTTIAAILGALPLAFGHGAGSELRRPLGIAIIGGLMVSQLLTLYTTPVVHLQLRVASLAVQQRWERLLRRAEVTPR